MEESPSSISVAAAAEPIEKGLTCRPTSLSNPSPARLLEELMSAGVVLGVLPSAIPRRVRALQILLSVRLRRNAHHQESKASDTQFHCAIVRKWQSESPRAADELGTVFELEAMRESSRVEGVANTERRMVPAKHPDHRPFAFDVRMPLCMGAFSAVGARHVFDGHREIGRLVCCERQGSASSPWRYPPPEEWSSRRSVNKNTTSCGESTGSPP